jgi:hypothetical protein
MTVTINQLAKVLYEMDFSFRLDRENEVAFVFLQSELRKEKKTPVLAIRVIENGRKLHIHRTKKYHAGYEYRNCFIKSNPKAEVKYGFASCEYSDESFDIFIVSEIRNEGNKINKELFEKLINKSIGHLVKADRSQL